MATKIQLRRDSAGNWASTNPLLAVGEVGVELDTRKFKIGDGAAHWNTLPYAVAGSDVRAGIATLASGSKLVLASWVTANTIVVVTPTAAPFTPGTALYVDPVDFVEGVSFTIKSDDATDARSVFYVATENTTIPILYVSLRVNVHDNDDPGDFIHVGDGSSNFVGVYHEFEDTKFNFYGNAGGAGNTESGAIFALDTWFTLEMKIVFSGANATVTPRVNGSALAAFDAPGLDITTIQFGSLLGNLVVTNHQLDDLKIGTTDWGTDDLFAADFNDTLIVPPFDSTTGTGLDASDGTLLVSNAGTDAYATKALSFP